MIRTEGDRYPGTPVKWRHFLIPNPYARIVLWLNICGFFLLLAIPAPAACRVQRLKGQTVYVPAYSQIFHGDKERFVDLTVTLSIRNTDPVHAVTLMSVIFYDSNGKQIRAYLETPLKLAPLASKYYVVQESDQSGGPGASFIVRWQADEKVTEPIIETVMISTRTQQGISFTSRGKAISEEGE